MGKTISICIPCYNSERYIRTTIESVLQQSVKPHEIIVSDDRSPDGSYQIVQEYARLPGVHVTRPPRRMTLGEHYRFLLEQATGDYVCFLSSDDALRQDFVETMTTAIGSEDGIGLVSAACLETKGDLTPVRVRDTERPQQALEPPAGFRYMLNGCLYTVSVSLFSRELLMSAPVIPHNADLATDWCWAFWVTSKAKLKFITKPMGYYRIHTSNAGHGNTKWEDASIVMRRWLQDELPPVLAQELRNHMAIPPSSTRKGVVQLSIASIKRMAKWFMALRYRSLPDYLLEAERGISEALKRDLPD